MSERSEPFRRAGKPFWLDVPGLSAFAEDVADAFLNGSELTYSRRQKLLKRADNFGIRRFDANLIIAMVQNRKVTIPPAVTKQPHRPWLRPAIMFVMIQSAIVAAAWMLLAPLF